MQNIDFTATYIFKLLFMPTNLAHHGLWVNLYYQKYYTSFHNHTLCVSLKILPIITPAVRANAGEIAIFPQIMHKGAIKIHFRFTHILNY